MKKLDIHVPTSAIANLAEIENSLNKNGRYTGKIFVYKRVVEWALKNVRDGGHGQGFDSRRKSSDKALVFLNYLNKLPEKVNEINNYPPTGLPF